MSAMNAFQTLNKCSNFYLLAISKPIYKGLRYQSLNNLKNLSLLRCGIITYTLSF